MKMLAIMLLADGKAHGEEGRGNVITGFPRILESPRIFFS